jgi:methylated-DNA-[protein]-cysteine S-methyltransferase
MNEIRYTIWMSPLGEMVLGASEAGLAGAWFSGERHFDGPQAAWLRDDAHALLRDASRQLQDYFAARLRVFDLPVAPAGTPFQRAVWRAIAAVPYGATTTYAALAQAAGASGAARAAGAATGRNPLSIIVPCHRIVGSDGSLTGYAGGLDRKRALLALETDAFELRASPATPRAAPSRAARALHS